LQSDESRQTLSSCPGNGTNLVAAKDSSDGASLEASSSLFAAPRRDNRSEEIEGSMKGQTALESCPTMTDRLVCFHFCKGYGISSLNVRTNR
jgi:hypothetical protein